MTSSRLPDDFVLGAATASFQIEGSTDLDGRGESIWDRFCRTPGKVANGDTGEPATDHYRRWRDDIALMEGIGITAYRFSIAWPRVLPAGRGAVNTAGLDFYDRLVDGLLDAGIEPFATLYHWDLPQALQDEGGWTVRTTAEAFADYAGTVAARLGDRVTRWATVNEPFVIADHGYLRGYHAPGHASTREAMAAAHHVLVGHGMAVPRIREAAPGAKVGITLDFEPKIPASDRPEDAAAAAVADAWMNRWYLDPLTGGDYPEVGVAAFAWDRGEVLPGDLDLIAAPVDWLGVNYYTREIVSANGHQPGDLRPTERRNDMGWEIHPEGLLAVLEWIATEYGFDEMYVTENGAAFADTSETPPYVDTERIAFLRDHLAMALEAVERGVPLRGYFVWSLLDNFEWAHGYGQRFGMVRVDYDTMERTVRASGEWYRDLIRSRIIR